MNLKRQKKKCRFLTKVKIAKEAIEKQLRQKPSILISPDGPAGNYKISTES
jgi:hypothetical protein